MNNFNENVFLNEVSKLVSSKVGVLLGDRQLHMVRSRMLKRARELNLEGLEAYSKYYYSNRVDELENLVSLLTTHHTFFFREIVHFNFLKKNLVTLVNQVKKTGRNKLRIWSAACSRGHEVYSLAMFFEYHLKQVDPSMSYEIVGSDVCMESVAAAKNGVYRLGDIKTVPAVYMDNNWTRGKGELSDYVKVKKYIRSKVSFSVENLLELNSFVSTNESFDLILCRNVFIYFDKSTIKKITANFLKLLNPNGYLMVGVSESLSDVDLGLEHLGISIYQHPQENIVQSVNTIHSSDIVPSDNKERLEESFQPIVASAKGEGPIKVLCVDDSQIYLKFIQTVFAKDGQFKVIGTASNGKEAKEFLKQNRVDVMTLDIHMPIQNGIDYLRENFNSEHPPVVMVSSISATDSEVAKNVIRLGASDYVEKDSKDMSSVVEEIRHKTMCAAEMGNMYSAASARKKIETLRRAPIISKSDEKLVFIYASMRDKEELKDVLKALSAPYPATFLIMDNADQILQPICEDLSSVVDNVLMVDESSEQTFLSNRVYIVPSAQKQRIEEFTSDKEKLTLILGKPSESVLQQAKENRSLFYFVEEFEGTDIEKLKKYFSSHYGIMPRTSILHDMVKYFIYLDKKSDAA